MWVSKDYVALLESQVEEYKRLWQDERRRGDRLQDALLVSSGHLPATETVVTEQRIVTSKAADETQQRRQEMGEMFADAVDMKSLGSLAMDAEAFGSELLK